MTKFRGQEPNSRILYRLQHFVFSGRAADKLLKRSSVAEIEAWLKSTDMAPNTLGVRLWFQECTPECRRAGSSVAWLVKDLIIKKKHTDRQVGGSSVHPCLGEQRNRGKTGLA
ncbi:hypothetical protein CHARACLAT_032628 [Characodon lateralis]|uniref:Uncharacterized protein n=1 Tax=Characodon lateralis TaxID=208331 RepID=A0ABU7F175_9TELE|nr:hypothetical protein [Characodon lateralis]